MEDTEERTDPPWHVISSRDGCGNERRVVDDCSILILLLIPISSTTNLICLSSHLEPQPPMYITHKYLRQHLASDLLENNRSWIRCVVLNAPSV